MFSTTETNCCKCCSKWFSGSLSEGGCNNPKQFGLRPHASSKDKLC